MYIPSILMIAGILTNDLHQWAFYFHEGYEAGWDIYQRGILYYIATAWIFTFIGKNMDTNMLRKLFAGLLFITGFRELFYRAK